MPQFQLAQIKELPCQQRARTYLATFVGTTVLSMALFYAALGVFRVADHLPPPSISGTWCIDGRFAWLRDNSDWKYADIIAVRSSATLRNFDFGVVSSKAQERRVVNAAPCFLTVIRRDI